MLGRARARRPRSVGLGGRPGPHPSGAPRPCVERGRSNWVCPVSQVIEAPGEAHSHAELGVPGQRGSNAAEVVAGLACATPSRPGRLRSGACRWMFGASVEFAHAHRAPSHVRLAVRRGGGGRVGSGLQRDRRWTATERPGRSARHRRLAGSEACSRFADDSSAKPVASTIELLREERIGLPDGATVAVGGSRGRPGPSPHPLGCGRNTKYCRPTADWMPDDVDDGLAVVPRRVLDR